MASPRELVDLLFRAMNERDLAILDGVIADDAVFHFPGTDPLVGPERIGRFIRLLFRRFPRLEFTVTRVVCEGDVAACEWRNEGHDRRGEPYRNAGATFVAVRDGRIVYISDTFKDTTLFMRRTETR